MDQPEHVRGDLPRLTGLRSVAALMVFTYHMTRYTDWAPGGTTFRLGFVGVGFFFILSGFVLTWVSKPGQSAIAFWTRRFARVYPAHFVMLLVAALATVRAQPITPAGVVTNVALLQAWFPQTEIAFGMNGVSWSLSCEAFFYLCAPFIIQRAFGWSERQLAARLGGWFLASVIATAALAFSTSLDIYAYTNPLLRSGEFALGILAAVLVVRGRLPRVPMSAALGAVVAVWLVTNFRILPQSVVDLCFDVPFLLVVVAGATTDLAGRRGVLNTRPFVYAGQVSYCFYLVHELVILNGNLIWGAWPRGTAQGALLMVGVFAIAAILAALLHHLVELPAQSAIRSWTVRHGVGR